MKKINIEKIIGILMLLFAIGFNLWLYRLEPTATVDPNDNAFQFALVDRTNTMWGFATRQCTSTILKLVTFPVCHFLYLADHWVPNWADGFNLPFYYSHIPQIVIVGSWRFIKLFTSNLTLFHYYHIVIYLLLCFFPLSVYLALDVMGLSPLTAGIGALFAMNLSTDGLYGLDPSSFLWRGYGLSSQLFAMIWFPLAIAYAHRYFVNRDSGFGIHFSKPGQRFTIYDLRFPKDLLLAVLFTTATTAGHLGIGMIAMISLGFLAISAPIMKLLRQEPVSHILESSKDQLIRLALVAGLSIFLLSYWIVPTFLEGNYHNISFWDPVWKFNSYGVKETMIRLFNGDLFDFGRLPIITYLSILGVIVGLLSVNRHAPNDKQENNDNALSHYELSPLSFLFIFWLLFYFGRTTWGSLIDLIPGMVDFHLSRFIVGLHIAGMLIAPIGFTWFVQQLITTVISTKQFAKVTKTFRMFIHLFVYTFIGILLIPPIFQWTITYNKTNDYLIKRANDSHAAVAADEAKLFDKLRSLPSARIFAGRGGGYGKEFRVAETPYFMQLSTFGLQTTMWLPETWSMDSDTEQFFSDNLERDYDLYNIRWVAAPPDQTPQPFWKQIAEAPTWKLYEVPTTGFFTTGVRAATVAITKLNFVNLVHLWIQSDAHAKGLFPELTFAKGYPKTYGLPNFKMTDEASYVTPDGKLHSLMNEPPVYLPPGIPSLEAYANVSKNHYDDVKILGPEVDDADMIFKTKVEVGSHCVECMVILKETFHPNWRAWVDGRSVKPIIVFPFFIGVPVTPGTHTVVVSYEPSTLKTVLFVLTILAVVAVLIVLVRQTRHLDKA